MEFSSYARITFRDDVKNAKKHFKKKGFRKKRVPGWRKRKMTLSNEELQLCHYHVCLPSNQEYSSLNLAMAVQTLCYDVRMSYLASQKSVNSIDPAIVDESIYPSSK